MVFDLRYFCKLSFEEIENMMPFERDIYIHQWEKQKEVEREQNKDNPLGALSSLAGM